MSRRFCGMRRAREGSTAGEYIGVSIATFVGVIMLAIALFGLSTYAHAHDTGKGWSYPWECCADHDCTEISADRVKPTPGGYIVDGKFTVAQKDVRDSPDGRYHACFPKPDFMRCFFAPPNGS